MVKKFTLKFERFELFKKNMLNKKESISCSQIGFNCWLLMVIRECIRNEEFHYDVMIFSVEKLKTSVAKVGSIPWTRLAIINCALIEKIPAELKTMIDKANECLGFIPTDYDQDDQPKMLADGYINYHFKSFDKEEYFNEKGLEEYLPVEKIKFCGDSPWELDLRDGYERYWLTSGQISFCSWRFADRQKITNPLDFYVTIIFKAYDHFRHHFLEITINACSPLWLERESANTSLLFLRYIIVMDQFREEYIKEYVFCTARASYQDNQNYPDYGVAELSYYYQLSKEYLQYAKESGQQYAYY